MNLCEGHALRYYFCGVGSKSEPSSSPQCSFIHSFCLFFDVKAQLSHRGDKLRLELVYLHISEYVINETGDSRGGLGTYNADAADKRSIHGHFYKALNSATL